jgi:hypothetical protein
MCDFREYTGRAINKITQKEELIPFIGTAAINEQIQYWLMNPKSSSLLSPVKNCPVYRKDKPEKGMYFVAASGSFFSYFDGNEWKSAYNNELYEFQFKEHQHIT